MKPALDHLGQPIIRPICAACNCEMVWQGDPCCGKLGYYCRNSTCSNYSKHESEIPAPALDQHPAAVAIGDVNNARHIVAYMMEHETEGSTLHSYLSDVARLLADVPATLLALRKERDDIEADRLALQDELQAALINNNRLDAYAEKVTAENSRLMLEKAEQQRRLELHAASLAEAYETINCVFRDAVQIKDATAPSTRLYDPKPHSVTLNEPRVVAGRA